MGGVSRATPDLANDGSPHALQRTTVSVAAVAELGALSRKILNPPSRSMNDESLREIVNFYTETNEESRLGAGSSQLEFERTKKLIRRFLPVPPAQVIDVGRASGPYAFWLASLGYQVHLIDSTPRLVHVARQQHNDATHRLESIAVGACEQRLGEPQEARHHLCAHRGVLRRSRLLHSPSGGSGSKRQSGQHSGPCDAVGSTSAGRVCRPLRAHLAGR